MKEEVEEVMVLAYAGCSTCVKALKWLGERGIAPRVRPIVDEPPTIPELKRWIAASALPIGKWFNTSGQSYRALGKEAVDAASDAQRMQWLAADGKLVKRPVLVKGSVVLVGFKPEAWKGALEGGG